MPTSSEINQAEEIQLEGRPAWRIVLAVCILGLTAFMVGMIALVAVFGATTLERVEALPAGFPAEAKIIYLESADSITVLSGGGRSSLLGIALAPLKILSLFKTHQDEPRSGILVSREPLIIEWPEDEPPPEGWFERAERLAEGVDTVAISWEDLPAERERILAHYLEIFGQAGMQYESVQEPVTQTDLLVGSKDGLEIQIHLKASLDGRSVEHLVIIVNYRNSL
jgi:hypothetical protein